MQQTTNYALKKIDLTDSPPDITVINPNWDTIDAQLKQNSTGLATHLEESKYKVAGGTATAITLTIASLVDGYSITFIASANNGGSATTINGKPLYKPNTTTAPNLGAGKAYTIWYNLTSDAFFIKASAEGDALTTHVLAGKIFSNENDTGLVGAIPSKTTQSYTPTTTNQTIASGQYLSGAQTIVGDADLVAGNIKSGVNIFGITGTLGVIKNIQRGLTNTTTALTNVPISSVEMNSYIILYSFAQSDVASQPGLELTTATNLAIYNATNQTSKVAWQVIEFNNVKSIQKGTLNTASGTTDYNIPISAVNMSKAIVVVSSLQANASYPPDVSANLSSATNIAVNKAFYSNPGVYWHVIEFN